MLQAEKNRMSMAPNMIAANARPINIGPMRLYVGSLHFNITEEMLKGIFEPFGKVRLSGLGWGKLMFQSLNWIDQNWIGPRFQMFQSLRPIQTYSMIRYQSQHWLPQFCSVLFCSVLFKFSTVKNWKLAFSLIHDVFLFQFIYVICESLLICLCGFCLIWISCRRSWKNFF